MRVLLTSIVAASLIAVVAAGILWSVQDPAYVNNISSSVRLGEPGENLVGRTWRGNPNLTQVPAGEAH